MAFYVDFGRIEKPHNSTYVGAHPVRLSCELKEECSTFNPSILVSISESDLFGNGTLNHCYIGEFDRYYFVNDWTYERGLWRADLYIDVMATWRIQIGNSQQYVLRAGADVDPWVVDSLYPITAQEYIQFTGLVSGSDWFDILNGTYIVGIISGTQQSTGAGSVAYYLFDDLEFDTFCQYLFGGAWLDINQIRQDMTDETWKSLYNPFQYIVSCYYLPFSFSGNTYNVQVEVGYWSIGMTARRVRSKSPEALNMTFQLLDHPQLSAERQYLNRSPFVELMLSIPPFGNFNLPPEVVYGFFGSAIGLTATIRVDIFTGKGILYVGSAAHPILIAETQVGIPIQIAQVATDYLNTACTALDMVGNVLSAGLSGDIGGVISSAANGIDSGIRAQIPRLQTMGGTGSFADVQDTPSLMHVFHYITETNYGKHGYPLCKNRQISTIAGYIKCSNAAVDTDGTDRENAEIVRIMNEGFYFV